MDLTGEDEGETIGYTDPWVASPGQQVSVKIGHSLESGMIRGFFCFLIFLVLWTSQLNVEHHRSLVPCLDLHSHWQELFKAMNILRLQPSSTRQ